jgi:hypothetical protein
MGNWKSRIAIAIGVGALACGPARAELIVGALGYNGNCGGSCTNNANTQVNFDFQYGGWKIQGMLSGISSLGLPELIDVQQTDARKAQGKDIKLDFSESGLTNDDALKALFKIAFNGNEHLVNSTRTFYLDTRDEDRTKGKGVFRLGRITTNGSLNLAIQEALHGAYSITEVVSLDVNGVGSKWKSIHQLSANDSVGLAVPEPATFAVMGTALLLAGAFRRRWLGKNVS